MSADRAHRWALIGGFVAMISAVPIGQAVMEIGRGQWPQAVELVQRPPTEANLRGFDADLEEASWFANAVRPEMQYLRYRLSGDGGEKAIVGRDGWWFHGDGVRYLVEPSADDVGKRSGPGPAVEAIVSFRDQLADRGIQLLVVPVPGKPNVYPEMMTRRAEGKQASVCEHTQQFIGRLHGAGVEVVDLAAVFIGTRDASTDDVEALYLQRDTHWTPRGAELAAKVVADRLMEFDWIDAGSVSYQTKEIDQSRKGDVVTMLQSPKVEAMFEPEVVTCRQVIEPGSGEPFESDPDGQVLVLGDSFLRIYELDEPKSAGFISHLARELGRPVASIVNNGGASTLVRQRLERQPKLLVNKRVVVWEFVERDIRFGMKGWQEVTLPPAVATQSAE